jgi:hypothetical protein
LKAPRATLGLIALAAVAAASPALAQAPPLDTARLDGTFDLAGRVTVAVHVRGEHAGDTVTRIWTFTSLCASGQCGTVRFVRHRAHGTDTLILVRRGPAFYRGTGSFYAPLRCAGRTYRKGQKVPFTIRVWIKQAALVNGQNMAASVRATYTNRRRVNLTRCVAVLGHDAARYHGQLELPPPPPPAPDRETTPAFPSLASSPQPAGS